jgi:D-tagatose 6-phosphate 4-epimerase
VTAIVVQPGVEFGVDRVTAYDPARARSLSEVLALQPGIQSPDTLRTLVSDGFAILKVGPALTFALREALYGLDKIALELDSSWREHSLQAAMERLMVGDPVNWVSYYSGGPQQQRLLRHYSYSDRHSLLLASVGGQIRCRPIDAAIGPHSHSPGSHQPVPAPIL